MIKVVVIEDNKLELEIICNALSADPDIEYYCTSESIRALSLIEEVRPDIVVLDVVMPNIGGLEIQKLLKEHEVLSKTPIVFLSGCEDNAKRARRAGCYAYITKPFSGKNLIRIIKDNKVLNLLCEVSKEIKAMHLAKITGKQHVQTK